MKKCCIIISGTIRLYDIYLIKFLKKLKETNKDLEIDIIISLNSNYVDDTVINILKPKKIFYDTVNIEIEDNNTVIQLGCLTAPCPVKISPSLNTRTDNLILEHINHIPLSRQKFFKNAFTNILHVYSMFFNNYKAFKLLEEYQRENNIIYDYIIKYRSDLCSDDNLILESSKETLYIPFGNDWGGLNDQVAYGDYTVMKKYCYLYENLDNLVFNMNIIYHPETLLKHHTENINIKRFNYEYKIARL